MARRSAEFEGLLGERGCDAALVYGAERAGTAVPWLTGWPVTREAALAVRAGEPGVMWVCYDNHVPNARKMTRGSGGARRWHVRVGRSAGVDPWLAGNGGLTHIHYLGVTPMADPGLCVPAQWPSSRKLAAGDALS